VSVQPFYCGSQFGDWIDRNCSRCSKYDPDEATGECEIDDALGMAYLGDGEISEEIARRMGYDEAVYSWDCPERVSRLRVLT
jgi:hypothetical protein